MKTSLENVFQIWRKLGEALPFRVRRSGWHPSTYFLVRRVEIRRYPYGKAFGDLYLRGVLSKTDIELSCASCYEWVLFSEEY